MYKYIILTHILAATIWTGGHIVLATCILPPALREKSPDLIESFESRFERLGVPALVVQVITGLWLAYNLLPSIDRWFGWNDVTSRLIGLKLLLLLITVILAIDSRVRLLPNLNQDNLVSLAYHIVAVTIVSVLFVVVGVGFRVGGY
jgi:putative copper export protein